MNVASVSPDSVFRVLARRPGCLWHDNAARPGTASSLAAEPAFRLTWRRGRGLSSSPSVPWLPRDMAPPAALRAVLGLWRLPDGHADHLAAAFGNGGWISYEAGAALEPTVPLHPPDESVPDLEWAFHDAVLVWPANPGEAGGQSSTDRTDHGDPGSPGGAPLLLPVDVPLWAAVGHRPAPREERIARLADLVRQAARTAPQPASVVDTGAGADAGQVGDARPAAPAAPLHAVGEMSRADYVRAVARTVEYVRAGDIFQANLSQRFTVPLTGSAPDLYLRLRSAARAPHAVWFAPGNAGDLSVSCASPELFLRLDGGGRILTRPIKGTRRRGADAGSDARLLADLESSPKDRAELAMIVDLLRNDLGRVARFGSMRVARARGLESFATVHHAVADVEGTLRAGTDAVDLLAATLPGGSITGAPKVRAMQIITGLERSERGVYTGCIGRFAADGGMELNIAIRTLVAVGGRVRFGVGGGVVADSDPEAEYDETLAKAAGLLSALGATIRP